MKISFPPTRTAALERLSNFVPKAGRDYAAKRNYDLPDQGHPHVSLLSPYLRHRLLTEEDILEATLRRYALGTAEKFVQEVCWRTYWKGWLELRPSVWSDYRQHAAGITPNDAIKTAEAGRTDIAAFNAWAQELVETGYMHNHARMWFASIWIFTLGLPWASGADFFMRHLIDGDPASNTLGWRWVAGIQTPGKHYIARSSNISKYTDGRHNPEWRLNTQAEPLSGPPHPARRAAPEGAEPLPGVKTGVLLHEDDLSPGWLIERLGGEVFGHASLTCTNGRSHLPVSDHVTSFVNGAVDDSVSRWSGRLGKTGPITTRPDHIIDWARSEGLEQIVTAYAPVGPTANTLRRMRPALQEAGIELVEVLRPWDAAAWPHATHGFFRFKKVIPDLVAHLTSKAA